LIITVGIDEESTGKLGANLSSFGMDVALGWIGYRFDETWILFAPFGKIDLRNHWKIHRESKEQKSEEEIS
jgi:hypothetical protein